MLGGMGEIGGWGKRENLRDVDRDVRCNELRWQRWPLRPTVIVSVGPSALTRKTITYLVSWVRIKVSLKLGQCVNPVWKFPFHVWIPLYCSERMSEWSMSLKKVDGWKWSLLRPGEWTALWLDEWGWHHRSDWCRQGKSGEVKGHKRWWWSAQLPNVQSGEQVSVSDASWPAGRGQTNEVAVMRVKQLLTLLKLHIKLKTHI